MVAIARAGRARSWPWRSRGSRSRWLRPDPATSAPNDIRGARSTTSHATAPPGTVGGRRRRSGAAEPGTPPSPRGEPGPSLSSEAHLLPDVDGLDVIELGCGPVTCRRGSLAAGHGRWVSTFPRTSRHGTIVGKDQHDLHFPLIQGSAEAVPLAGASFDLAISEYGAAIWCDSLSMDPGRPPGSSGPAASIFLGTAALVVSP